MTLEQLIHQHLDELSDLDKDILQFMLANPDKVRACRNGSCLQIFCVKNN